MESERERKDNYEKKVAAFLLAVSVTIITVGTVQAAVAGVENEVETDAEIRERVFEEIRSGNITNDEDIIKVALDQYEERLARSRMRASDSKQEEIDDSFSITQVMGRHVDEQGNLVEDVMSTGLIVLDESNNMARASTITSSENAQLSEYSIYCTMNVNFTVDRHNPSVKLNGFDTTLHYGTSMKAWHLLQGSKYAPEPFFEYDDVDINIDNPAGDRAYHYTPRYKEMVPALNMQCGRSCRSVITANSRSFVMGYAVTTEHLEGYWQIQYN